MNRSKYVHTLHVLKHLHIQIILLDHIFTYVSRRHTTMITQFIVKLFLLIFYFIQCNRNNGQSLTVPELADYVSSTVPGQESPQDNYGIRCYNSDSSTEDKHFII